MRSKFIINELWRLSVAGALQRGHIYKDVSESEKKAFRRDLKNYLEQLVTEHYFNSVSEENHLDSIKKVATFSKKYKHLLHEGALNFGIAQKVLNLFLKYLWCLKMIPAPPHFPVDRTIQEKLNELAKKYQMPIIDVKAWTQFKDETYYMEVIEFAKQFINNIDDLKTYELARLELELSLEH